MLRLIIIILDYFVDLLLTFMMLMISGSRQASPCKPLYSTCRTNLSSRLHLHDIMSCLFEQPYTAQQGDLCIDYIALHIESITRFFVAQQDGG